MVVKDRSILSWHWHYLSLLAGSLQINDMIRPEAKSFYDSSLNTPNHYDNMARIFMSCPIFVVYLPSTINKSNTLNNLWLFT